MLQILTRHFHIIEPEEAELTQLVCVALQRYGELSPIQPLLKTVPPNALALLFKSASETVKCVLINACYSEVQAKAISQFIPIVIGTKKEISDNAAIKFSTGFYTALEPDLSQKSFLKLKDLI